MKIRKHRNTYDKSQCALYKLNTKRKLAKLLFIGIPKLKELAASDNLYYVFERVHPVNGKVREISAPRADLKLVQKRIAELLQRIAPPDYLFSPVKGRSYIDNANCHKNSPSIKLLDITDFYPSCKQEKVKWFFRTHLKCSDDVAAILRDVVCHDGSLPQGSPCSPILAFLAYIEMWDEIENEVRKSGCDLSLYVDDLTFSGEKIPGELVWNAKRILKKHGHSINTSKERTKFNRPAEVTGVVVRNGKLMPPNRQRLQLTAALREYKDEGRSASEKMSLKVRVRSRASQITQILNRND